MGQHHRGHRLGAKAAGLGGGGGREGGCKLSDLLRPYFPSSGTWVVHIKLL